MAIKREETEKKEIGFKGIFKGIDSSGFLVEDLKTGDKEILGFDDFNQFIDKEVVFGIVETKKKSMEVEE